jgi:hypothetical protein
MGMVPLFGKLGELIEILPVFHVVINRIMGRFQSLEFESAVARFILTEILSG